MTDTSEGRKLESSIMKETKKETVPNKPRRKFDANFKRDAVLMWLNSGKSAQQIGAELGLLAGRLYLWRKTHGPVSPAAQTEAETEVSALRRENAQLRQQRDILKKTLGILSEPPNSASGASTL